MPVHDPRVETERPGRRDQFHARIHANDLTAELDQPAGQDAVAAPQIEDPLARARHQQVDHGLPEVGYEPRVARVYLGMPGLG